MLDCIKKYFKNLDIFVEKLPYVIIGLIKFMIPYFYCIL